MKYLNGMVLAMALASPSFAVSVDFYDEQQNNPSATGIRLRINNDSNAPITNAKLRYYYHRTSAPDTVDAYYLPNATVSKNNVNDTLAYFELSIPSISIGYYPDMSGFSLALHNQNWSSRDKTKDFSYQTSSSLTQNAKIVLLSGDDVIFGAGPNVQSVSEPGILKISGLKFSDSAWIEIKNVGASTVSLSDYQLVNTNDSAFSLGSDTLAVNEILRVCQSQAACGDAGKTLVNSVFGWDSTGEAILKKDTSMASYVAWGEPGLHAAAAVEVGLWNDSLDYFPAETHVQQYNADYIKNMFFRLKSNKSGTNTDDWFSFTSNDNPAKANSIPSPIKTSANQPVYKLIPGENGVLFSWLPIEGIDSYRVIVRDQNENDIYNLETMNTSIVLPVAPGNYHWTVIGEDEFNVGLHPEYPRTDYCNTFITEANINTSIFKQLKIHQIKARRDTRMLNLGYFNEIDKYSWDRPNLDSKIEPADEARCWAVAIEVMNHFYGGNLTQDEIVYKGQFSIDDPYVIPLFGLGGDLDIDPITGKLIGGNIPETMKWALNLENFEDLNFVKGSPSYEVVKNAIDQEKLVYVNVPGHAMVIFGYVGEADNYAFYYAFDGYNDGYITTSLMYTKPIDSYFIPNAVHGNAKMSDSRVHMDSDGDGVTNFEEEERFHTDPYFADSDNDGIEDKREIYNYTRQAARSAITGGQPTPYDNYPDVEINGKTEKNPLLTAFIGIRNKADENKNGVYAERDPDDNSDGINDGLCDYNLGRAPLHIENMDVPANYTIYGREFVAINDNAKCFNTQTQSNDYCNIASSDEDIFSYGISYSPISIGARAHVGDVSFRNRGNSMPNYPNVHEKAILRSNAVVHGSVVAFVISPGYITQHVHEWSQAGGDEPFFSMLDISEYIAMQNGSVINGNVSIKRQGNFNEYIYAYTSDMPAISETQVKMVQNGETYHLKDGDKFSSLKVQSGGTLIIEPGEMFVDKLLQIDANATIRFAEPGKGTVLHTNGKIIWHTYNSEPITNTQYWINVAKGFKLAHHSSQKFYLEGMWAGTIYAPKAKVVLGQVTKTIYGRFLARDVVVHQFAKVYRVDFDPTDAMQVSYAF